MRRRGFLVALGGATAWPMAAWAQQTVKPVVGFLNAASSDSYVERLRAFREGLGEQVALFARGGAAAHVGSFGFRPLGSKT